MKENDKYHIDTDRVSQYEGERVVDNVTIVEAPTKHQKKVLVPAALNDKVDKYEPLVESA